MLEFIAIFSGTMIREIIEKVDISDDSYCSIAQLVEPATVNRVVPGSSPGGTAKTQTVIVRRDNVIVTAR